MGLETLGVAAGELFGTAGLGFCFAWGGLALVAGEGSWGSGEGVGGESVPFLTALAFSAFRCACAGFMDFSFAIVAILVFLHRVLRIYVSVLGFKRFYPVVVGRIRCKYSQQGYAVLKFDSCQPRPFDDDATLWMSWSSYRFRVVALRLFW